MALEHFLCSEHTGITEYTATRHGDTWNPDKPTHRDNIHAQFGAKWEMKWGTDAGARQKIYLEALFRGLELVPAGHVFEVRTREFPKDNAYTDFGRIKLPPPHNHEWGVAWYYEVCKDDTTPENDALGLFMVSHVDQAVLKMGYRLAARIRSPEVQ